MPGNPKLYSLSPFLTEEPFLERELGFRLKYIEKLSELPVDDSCQVNLAVTNMNILSQVEIFERYESVRLFVLGNETLDREIFHILSNLPSRFTLYAQYTNQRECFYTSFLNCLFFIRDGISRNYLQLSRDLKTRFLKGRTLREFDNLHLVEMPLGYSRSFANQLVKRFPELTDYSSLVNSLPNDGFFPISKKKLRFGFVGQVGNSYRQGVLDLARNRFQAQIEVEDKFGGNHEDDNSSYIQMLENVGFNLIPPGFHNIRNFRYLESVLAGSIPITVSSYILDPTSNSIWTRCLSNSSRYSWYNLLEFVQNMSPLEVEALYFQIRREVVSEILSFRKLLSTE